MGWLLEKDVREIYAESNLWSNLIAEQIQTNAMQSFSIFSRNDQIRMMALPLENSLFFGGNYPLTKENLAKVYFNARNIRKNLINLKSRVCKKLYYSNY